MGRVKKKFRTLFLSATVLAACAAVQAQSPAYNLGKSPSAEELRGWDINISPEGKGLPSGSGSASEGAKLFEQKCAMCHGANGIGGQAQALVVNKIPTPPYLDREPFPFEVPFATVIWDYIRRAMPMLIGPGTLKPDEVYSLTAFLLYKNGIIKENDVLDAQTLPKVKMPNRDAFALPGVEPRKP